MDAFDVIKKRRSVRSFVKREVEFEKIINILDAAHMAPSAGNVQDWKFIVVYREETKAELTDCCPKQEWMVNAPILIVITVDADKDEDHYGQRGKELYSIQNGAAAAENLLIAATAQGLGTCWVGAFNEDNVKKAIDIPEDVRPVAIIALGYYDVAPVPPPKKRLEEVVYFHKWDNKEFNLTMAQGAYHEYVTSVLNKIKKWMEK